MIIDYRAYTLKVGTVSLFLKLFAEEGRDVQKRILGNFIGMFRTEIGNTNQIIHMWGYANLEERQRRRAECAADPTFLAYVKKARDYIVEQDVRILVPEAGTPDLSKF